VDGDKARLSQVFANLLSNAAKYTARGGRITLGLRCVDSHAEIHVIDRGIGLTPEQMTGIFEMFAQVSNPLDQTESGLGVGLTLARQLVELHGGQIEVRSAGPGQGSDFIVRIPALRADDMIHRAADTRPAATPPPRRILVADDNVDSAEMLGFLLRASGHDVRVAHDGIAAVEAWETFHPDLVILDIGMPRLNGYDAARQIRSKDGAKTVLVALTGWGQEHNKQLAREAGFDHHLTKPIDPGAITTLLAQLP
jgi:CheY-like chemotaxis protein